MIIYGWKSTHLKQELLAQGCPTCGKHNTITMAVFQRYAHIFWIPLIPIGKQGVSRCQHCGDTLDHTQMPSSLKKTYGEVKTRSKVPLWTFSGLAILSGLVIAGVVNGRQKTARNEAMIAAPHEGDILEVKIKSDSYTLYKVADITADSAYLLMNQYETNKASGLSTIKGKGASAFLTTPVGFGRKELKSLFDQGMIIDIER